MVTLYAFSTTFPGRGETKDLRAQWALEEMGLPYRVHALDHTAGELDGEAYSRIIPFHQVPVLDDNGGFVVAESAAVVLHLAEKAGKLIPADAQGRTRVVQLCFAATSTIEPTFTCIDFMEMFDKENAAPKFTKRCASSPAAGSATSSGGSTAVSGSPAPTSRWPT